ncbi:MAG TPA: 3',5'-cyclic-nucleotide phosphodiesterase [Nevskiaceae bacterium]|nr:3',5'-cyclic-nucleotide phosphodiesterase [Nevskiaceae bacterium]
MKIDILGCNGGVGPGLRTTCLRLDDTILVDAGTGACDLDLPAMNALTDVFLTHAHLDHTAGLAFIADNRIGRGATRLRIHGTAETLQSVHTHLFNWAVWPDFTALPSPTTPVLSLHPLDSRPVDCGGLSFTPFPALHTIPTNGYAVRHAGGIFAFTGDTYGSPAMWQALNALERLDQLMVEVSYGDELARIGELARHLTPTRLAEQLRTLRHRPELLLTHAKPGHEAAVRNQCRGTLTGWRYRHLATGERFTV